MGLLVSSAKTEMALFREASGSQTSGDKCAWTTRPTGWKGTYFSPLINLCIYLCKGTQRTSGMFIPFSLKWSLSMGQERKGPVFLEAC